MFGRLRGDIILYSPADALASTRAALDDLIRSRRLSFKLAPGNAGCYKETYTPPWIFYNMPNVTVACWNVNSVRTRLPHLLGWLQNEKPDIVLLQELK
jgi:hypothetical protein